MYNILEVEDKIKGLPDQALMREAQFPSGDVPQFLVVSELQRRNEMRKSYAAMQEPSQTVPVAQQVVAEAGQGIAGVVGGNALPVSAPMQAQTPMAAPMQSSMPAPMQPPVQPPMQPPMPRPQAPAGIVGMQSGRQAPYQRQYRDFAGEARDRRERKIEELYRDLNPSQATTYLSLIESGVDPEEALFSVSDVYRTDDTLTGVEEIQSIQPFDPSKVPSKTAGPIGTEYDDPLNLDLTYGDGFPVPVPDPADPPPDPSQLELGSYRQGIMDLTKAGREDIATLRGQINELDPYQASFTERDFIADNIDRQSYIDRLSNIAGEDIASREVLIDELQEKSKKDALSAFLMSFGAGVAGGDLSGGIQQGSKAAQDVKQIADKRLFDERKAMRDVKSAAEREAVQLGLSAEEAALAGQRAEQQFGADQDALRNTIEFQNYTTSRQQLLDQISGAREDVTTIATLMKNEADIINDANRIRQAFEAEAGRERRDIRNYIEEFVKAHRETLEASLSGITDPSSVTNLVDSYRKLLEQEFNLREADDESSPPSAVEDLVSSMSINRSLTN
mgnify:FL=1|jgi:hypothetical protein